MLQTVHTWEADGKRYRAVIDETYATRGSYAYGTEEEIKAWEDLELRMLRHGKWIVIGIIISENTPVKHCETCACKKPEWHETDSLWGIVIESDKKTIEQYAKDCI